MILFNEYVDRHHYFAKRKLRLLKNVLEKDGLRIEDFTRDEQEPYIFVYAYPVPTTFEGIRFYMLGDILAFKTQKKAETQPYGESYELDLQAMLIDIFDTEKDKSEKHITNLLMKLIGRELRDHFKRAKKAEDELLNGQVTSSKDAAGQIVIRNGGNDYSNTIFSKWN
jgi:hypothetical protein